MSEEKRVIRVKNLIIEAENVIVQPKRREYDPIIGRPRRHEDDQFESSSRENDNRRDNDEDNRRSFWI